MRGPFSRVAGLLLLLLGAKVVCAQTTVSNQLSGYTVTLPNGWEQIPRNAIEAQMQSVAQTVGGQLKQHYEDGFQKIRSPNLFQVTGSWFHYPYILVESKQNGRIPEGQVARMKTLRSDLQKGADSVGKTLDPIVSGMTLGDTYYDPSNKCIMAQITLNVASVGQVRGLSCGFLTDKGLVIFSCYALAVDFDEHLPVFQEIIKSVQIAEELRYKPQIGDAAGFDVGRIIRSGLIGGLIGGAFGLVVWFMRRLQKRKDAAAQPPPLS